MARAGGACRWQGAFGTCCRLWLAASSAGRPRDCDDLPRCASRQAGAPSGHRIAPGGEQPGSGHRAADSGRSTDPRMAGRHRSRARPRPARSSGRLGRHRPACSRAAETPALVGLDAGHMLILCREVHVRDRGCLKRGPPSQLRQRFVGGAVRKNDRVLHLVCVRSHLQMRSKTAAIMGIAPRGVNRSACRARQSGRTRRALALLASTSMRVRYKRPSPIKKVAT
jgi:hypothetical protein